MKRFNRNNQMKPVEFRFRRAQELMRTLRVNHETKQLQMDIAWTMDHIERYGFAGWPNHYIYDDIIRFEAMVKQLAEHPTTKTKG